MVEPRPRARFEPDSLTAANLQPRAFLEDDAAPPVEDSLIPNALASLDPPASRRFPAPPSETEDAAGRSMPRRLDVAPHPNPPKTRMVATPPVPEEIQPPSRVQPGKEIRPSVEGQIDPVPHRRADAPTGALLMSSPRLPEPIAANVPQQRAMFHPLESHGDAKRQKEGPSGTQEAVDPAPQVTPSAKTDPGAPPPALPGRQSIEPEAGADEQAPPDTAETASDPPTPQRGDQALLVPPVWLDQLRSEWDHHREGPRTRRPSEPTIQVTIGRVEVRAEAPPPPAARAKAKAPAVMTLEDYLNQRKGRGSP